MEMERPASKSRITLIEQLQMTATVSLLIRFSTMRDSSHRQSLSLYDSKSPRVFMVFPKMSYLVYCRRSASFGCGGVDTKPGGLFHPKREKETNSRA